MKKKAKKRGKSKKVFWIIGVVLVIILILVGLNIFTSKSQSNGGGNGGNYEEIVFGVAAQEDYDNFENIIKNNQMIQDLPDSGTVLLSFYNFYSGNREIERDYILTKNNVQEESTSEYDIKLIMHSKYLTILKPGNLCGVIKLAKNKGDFATETAISKTKLLWRYKGMMDYKDCLGL